MGPRVRRVVAHLAAFDAHLTTQLNLLARTSPVSSGVAVQLAGLLASVEVLLMGGLFLGGRRQSAGRMLAAVGIVYLASEALGGVWRRQRPFADLEGVDALVAHVSQRSFPSRHVASGLAMAAIGGRAHASVGLAMTIVAWVLGASRVASGLHYPTDVLAGAVLGTAVGRLLREPHSGRRTC